MFLETLDVEREEEQLKKDLSDISSDNPRTQVASFRIKRWIGKATKETSELLRGVVVEIASEAAKKAIWPGK